MAGPKIEWVNIPILIFYITLKLFVNIFDFRSNLLSFLSVLRRFYLILIIYLWLLRLVFRIWRYERLHLSQFVYLHQLIQLLEFWTQLMARTRSVLLAWDGSLQLAHNGNFLDITLILRLFLHWKDGLRAFPRSPPFWLPSLLPLLLLLEAGAWGSKNSKLVWVPKTVILPDFRSFLTPTVAIPAVY